MNKMSFRFLWIGQTFANLGDILYIVGLITMIYQLTGSAIYMSLVPFFITMSQFISGVIAPLVIDKYRLKLILAFSQTGKTILLFGLGILVLSNGFNHMLPLLFFLVFFISFLDGWSTPARNSMIPLLVPSNELVKANSFLSVLDQTVRLGGWAAGGIFVAFLGSNLVIIITFVLYLISSVMMFLIQETDFIKSGDTPIVEKGNWAKLTEGWVLIWKVPALRTINIMGIFEALANTVWIAAILYIYVDVVLQAGEQWWGYINASFFLGLIIGGILSLRYSHVMSKRLSVVIIYGTLLGSIFTLLFAINSLTWVALVLSSFIGFSEQLKEIAQQTTIQKSASNQELPKIYSAQYALYLVTYGTAVLLVGILTELWGVRVSFFLAACLLFVSFVISMVNQRYLQQVEER